jgi:V/A-type H+-transporting ATPase subunit I
VAALKSMAGLGGLIQICGVSATIFGAIYGSFLGFEDISIFGEGFKLFGVHLPFSPIHNILQILMVAIGAGVVLLILGFLIGIFNGIVSREWGHLLFGHNGVAGFLLYLSLLGIGAASLHILPVSPIVFVILAALSAVAVMFSEVFIHLVEGYRPLVNGGMGTYVIQAGVELFEVIISFLSNTLSYVRVGAFAVAHGGLSAAIFILAELVSPAKGLPYWVVVAIGNLFIVGFEGLIVGIQTMRLHYYEFLGKFFTGGGMRFEPLAITPIQEE